MAEKEEVWTIRAFHCSSDADEAYFWNLTKYLEKRKLFLILFCAIIFCFTTCSSLLHTSYKINQWNSGQLQRNAWNLRNKQINATIKQTMKLKLREKLKMLYRPRSPLQMYIGFLAPTQLQCNNCIAPIAV